MTFTYNIISMEKERHRNNYAIAFSKIVTHNNNIRMSFGKTEIFLIPNMDAFLCDI